MRKGGKVVKEKLDCVEEKVLPRAVAARGNYLGLDRVDMQFTEKEV